jgi:hypothetical protein
MNHSGCPHALGDLRPHSDFKLRYGHQSLSASILEGVSAQRQRVGQIGKKEFTIDLRRGEGRKLNFSLVSLKKGHASEKVLLFLELIFLVNKLDNPTSNLT